MDRRDEQTWIAIELSKQGELKIDEGTLESSLRTDLGVEEEHPIFVPAATYTRGGKKITIHLLEGYAFVGSGLPETKYFHLESKVYVSQVMSTLSRNGMRVLSTISDRKIREMRHNLQHQVSSHLTPNTLALITNGLYQNLEGVVVEVTDEYAVLRIQLRALQAYVSIPFAFLEPLGVEQEPTPSAPLPAPVAPQDLSSDPTARCFYEPLVAALGDMTGYCTGLFLPMEEVQLSVLRQAGYDPESLPAGLDLEGQKGVLRRIGWAFRNQRKGYCKTPLTLLGPKRGEWGLTPEGVEEARRLNGLA